MFFFWVLLLAWSCLFREHWYMYIRRYTVILLDSSILLSHYKHIQNIMWLWKTDRNITGMVDNRMKKFKICMFLINFLPFLLSSFHLICGVRVVLRYKTTIDIDVWCMQYALFSSRKFVPQRHNTVTRYRVVFSGSLLCFAVVRLMMLHEECAEDARQVKARWSANGCEERCRVWGGGTGRNVMSWQDGAPYTTSERCFVCHHAYIICSLSVHSESAPIARDSLTDC